MEQDPKYPVILRVYDLSNGLASLHSERLLGVKLDGIWHTSLEVYNKEIYFQNGIVQGVPGNCGIPVKVIEYGHTEVTEEITNSYLEDLKEKYNPASYHLFMNNCNHFSEDLLNFLTGQSIPEDIRQLPELVMKNPMFGALMCMMNQNQPKSEQ